MTLRQEILKVLGRRRVPMMARWISDEMDRRFVAGGERWRSLSSVSSRLSKMAAAGELRTYEMTLRGKQVTVTGYTRVGAR